MIEADSKNQQEGVQVWILDSKFDGLFCVMSDSTYCISNVSDNALSGVTPIQSCMELHSSP